MNFFIILVILIVAILVTRGILNKKKEKKIEEARAYFGSAKKHIEANNLEQALKDYNTGMEISPKPSHYSYRDRADLLSRMGKYEEAIADYSEIIKVRLKDLKFAVKLPPDQRGSMSLEYRSAVAEAYGLRGDMHSAMGNTSLAQDDYNEAIEYYNMQVQLAPKSPHYLSDRGEMFLKWGDTARAMADLDKAISLCDKHVASDPTDAFYINCRAKTYARKGNLDLAIEDYQKVLAIDIKTAEDEFDRDILLDEQEEARKELDDLKKRINQ